jgi:GNAT superfamily N-acetyltransferase
VTLILRHRPATVADVPMLARMNQPLIEDEGHRNPMDLSELKTRMRSMLGGDYTATLFEGDKHVVGYALWRDEPDWLYLRQFFVARDYRRRGIGAQAVRLLTEVVWPAEKRVRVNVLIGNRAGMEFWRAVGFADYLVTLEMERTG